MVYTCSNCKKPSMRSYCTRDGLHDCLCLDCFTKYEKETSSNENQDSDSLKEMEDRLTKKLQSVVKSIKQVGNRLQEHENKIGALTRNAERLEKEIQKCKKD